MNFKQKYLIKILGVVCMALSIINFSGCGNKDNSNFAENDKLGYQLEKPSKNEEVAVVNTNLGSFKIRFFAEEAPKAVENFKTHSKNGYYNGISFHRVIKDFMIQGGDPEGNGTGGQSIWGTDFNDEFSENLINITGSISMANRGPNTNGSQFFINNKSPLGQEEWNNYEKMFNMHKKNPAGFAGRYGTTLNMDKVTSKYKDLYNKYGGNPHLDGYYSTANRGHTVFGQVFEGMDVVNKISDVEVGANDVPTNKVEIQNISIENME